MVEKHKTTVRGPAKTFQQNGHWIERPEKSVILLCVCGNRYLKTRTGQDKCLRCFCMQSPAKR